MITSSKGKRFLEYISPIYEQSVVMQAILEAIGQEWDDADRLTDEVLAQLFPQTATWGIVYWESLLGIPSDDSIPIEQRRTLVLSRMQTRWPVTRERMEQIIRTYSGDKQAYIKEIFGEYYFEVFLNLIRSVDLSRIYEVVSEARPVHLDFALAINLRQGEKSVFIGSAMLVGEEVTVYPWTVSELTSQGKIHIAAGHSTGVDTVTVYPKGE